MFMQRVHRFYLLLIHFGKEVNESNLTVLRGVLQALFCSYRWKSLCRGLNTISVP